MSPDSLRDRIRACGTCECKDRCAEREDLRKPNPYGVCEVQAAEDGWEPMVGDDPPTLDDLEEP